MIERKKIVRKFFQINFPGLYILQWIYHSLQVWTWFSFRQFWIIILTS